MPIPVILDVDTGVDDAMALLLAARSPDLDLLAVTCVHGNAGIDVVVENTFKVLDAAAAPASLPVAKGAALPLLEPARTCLQIHGSDGLGDLMPPLPKSARTLSPLGATELLAETLQKAEAPVTVIALAPLTNIAAALRRDADLWRSKVERIVWMGGAVAAGGNATTWAEANCAYDPEAAHIVLSFGLPILMYPWDVFLKVGYNKDELVALGLRECQAVQEEPLTKRSRVDSAADLAGRLLYREMRHFKTPEAVIGDAGAVVAAVLTRAPCGGTQCMEKDGENGEKRPLTVRHLHVVVELRGQFTRGMTVCELRGEVFEPDDPKSPANVHVVTDVDVAAVKQMFTQHVLTAAPALA